MLGLHPGKLKVDPLGSGSKGVPKPCTGELWDDSQLPVEFRGSQNGLPKFSESGFESQNQLESWWDLKP
jgi:hypothetical protein